MKDDYDFTGAERGRFYAKDAVLVPPIHLDPDVLSLPIGPRPGARRVVERAGQRAIARGYRADRGGGLNRADPRTPRSAPSAHASAPEACSGRREARGWGETQNRTARVAPARTRLKPKPLRGAQAGPGLTRSRSGARGPAWVLVRGEVIDKLSPKFTDWDEDLTL